MIYVLYNIFTIPCCGVPQQGIVDYLWREKLKENLGKSMNIYIKYNEKLLNKHFKTKTTTKITPNNPRF